MSAQFLGESLIFLISQPRAGSTLLQRILTSHPEVVSAAEPWLMLHPFYALRSGGLQAEYNAEWARQAIEDYLNHYAGGEERYFESVRAMAAVLYGIHPDGSFRNMAQQKTSPGDYQLNARYFLDKTPRYYLILPELYRCFPLARFVFLVRNPLAVLASMIETWVRPMGWPYLENYQVDLLKAPGLIYAGMKNTAVYSIAVRYEDLVCQPEQTVQSLCNFLQLDYQPSMLHYADTPLSPGRMGDKTQVDRYQEPVTDRLDQWKRLFEEEQTRHFAQEYLRCLDAEFLTAFDYAEIIESAGRMYLDQSKPSRPHKRSWAIFPWQVALKPWTEWARPERLAARRALAIQERGLVRGLFYFVYNNFFSLIRNLLKV